jgi:hypothetical protein
MAKSDLIKMLKQGYMLEGQVKPIKAKKQDPAKKSKRPVLSKDEALQKAAGLAVLAKAGVKNVSEKRASLKQIIRSEGVDATLNGLLKYLE